MKELIPDEQSIAAEMGATQLFATAEQLVTDHNLRAAAYRLRQAQVENMLGALTSHRDRYYFVNSSVNNERQ